MGGPEHWREPDRREAAGAATLIDTFLECGPGDGLVLAYSAACRLGVAWIEATAALNGVTVRLLPTDVLDDAAFGAQAAAVVCALEETCRHVTVAVCDDAVLRHSHSLRALQRDRGARVARVMNCRPELFELALQLGPDELSRANAVLLDLFGAVDEIRVGHPDHPTDLAIAFDHDRYRWGSSRGRLGPAEIPVLPAGEVNTYPRSVSGEFVVDGAIHTNFAVDFDVRLRDRPLRVVLDRGEVRELSCPDGRLESFLHSVLERENMQRVGEIGFGTNAGIGRFVPEDSHINERRCGLHLGLGEHNQPGLVDYVAPFHVDLISAGGFAVAGGRVQSLEGQGAPRAAAHPDGIRGEDLDHFPDWAAGA